MLDILDPWARVKIGEDDIFESGDGILQSVVVELNEGQDLSNCEFAIADPELKWADKYFAYIEKIEGLTPLRPPSQGRTVGSQSPGSGTTADGSLSVNMRAMLDLIAWAEGAEYNSRFGDRAGQGTLQSLADHPRRVWGNRSSAAGRYQALTTSWDETAGQLGLTDFSPASQDRFAVARIQFRGATAAVEAGNVQLALTGTGGNSGLAWEWASLPPFRYPGQGTKTMQNCIDFFNQRVAFYSNGGEAQQAAAESTTNSGVEIRQSEITSNQGSQITIELGFKGKVIASFSFLHQSLRLNYFPFPVLTFGGLSAAWVLTRRVRSTAYQNQTFKQIAQKICDQYGLELDMQIEGDRYEYFPQLGKTDYETLLIEARRLGLRVYNKGNTLYIRPRVAEFIGFVLDRENNLGMEFTVSHQAQSGGGGARASAGQQSGQRKFELDPVKGTIVQQIPENREGESAAVTTDAIASSTGAAVPDNKPNISTADPGTSDRVGNEDRIKGVICSFVTPLTPEVLLLDPDTPFQTFNFSDSLDRVWVIESVRHEISVNGSKTTGSCYSPMKNRFPPLVNLSGTLPGGVTQPGEVPPLNPNGFIRPTDARVNSPFGMRNGRMHRGVDMAAPRGTPIWASADGVVVEALNSCVEGATLCGGKFGNRIYIDHADGYRTRYAHLQQGTVNVTVGQQVKQGEKIAGMGNTGSSTGSHLHFEVIRGGTHLNPMTVIPRLPGDR